MFHAIDTATAPRRRTGKAALCAGLAALLTAAGAQAAPPQAGVSSAVTGAVSRASTLESDIPEADRSLQIGSKVFMQDRVSSGADSRAQILLMDESTFKLGPESDLVIDEFVYDPASGTGELVAQAALGTFRFVSGAIGKTNAENVQIETPVATMGVRGTIATVQITRDANGNVQNALFALSGPGIENNANARRGAIQVTSAGQTVTIQRTGWGSTVAPGQPPSPPAPLPADVLNQLNTQLSSTGGDDGGDGDPTGGSVASQGAASSSGQITALAQNTAQSVQQTQDTSSTSQTIASGEEQEDAVLGDSAGQPVLIEPGTSPSGIFNNLDQPVSTFDLVQQVSSGIATASESGVKMVDLVANDISRFGSNSEINVFSASGLEQFGSYDVFFEADFSAKTFTARFDNIDVSELELANGSVSQSASFPESGTAFITFSASGADGIVASQGCQSNNCSGAIDLLALDGQPIGGIAHSLRVGDFGGAGSLRTVDQ